VAPGPNRERVGHMHAAEEGRGVQGPSVRGVGGRMRGGGAGDQAVPNRQEPPHHTHMRLRPAQAQAAVARVVPS
jgi:hypothetical protein